VVLNKTRTNLESVGCGHGMGGGRVEARAVECRLTKICINPRELREQEDGAVHEEEGGAHGEDDVDDGGVAPAASGSEARMCEIGWKSMEMGVEVSDGRVPSSDEDARAVLPGGGGVGADDGEDHGRGLLSDLGDAEGAGGLVGASVGKLNEAVGIELVGGGGLGCAVHRGLGVADDDGVERGGDGSELGGARIDCGAVGAGRAEHFESVVGLCLGDLVACDALRGGDEGVEDARAGRIEGCTFFVERMHGYCEEVGEIFFVAIGAIPIVFVVPGGLELIFGDGFDAGACDGPLGDFCEVGGAVVGVRGELEPDGEGGEDEAESRDGDCDEPVSSHFSRVCPMRSCFCVGARARMCAYAHLSPGVSTD
jgi:hypothetical protein